MLYCPGPYPRILIADFGLARPNAYQETMNVCGTVSYLPPEGILALDNKHLGYTGCDGFNSIVPTCSHIINNRMPADCWSAGVILYVMLAYVSWDIFCSFLIFCWISGMHPFDNEPFPDASSWLSHLRESCGPWPSKNYFQAEARLKERIVSGKVDFQPCIWDKYPDGMLCFFLWVLAMILCYCPARCLVTELLMHDPLRRATVYSALESRWIILELKELCNLYRQRIGESTGL